MTHTKNAPVEPSPPGLATVYGIVRQNGLRYGLALKIGELVNVREPGVS